MSVSNWKTSGKLSESQKSNVTQGASSSKVSIKVTTKLVEEALDNGLHNLIETNKPGKHYVQVKLSCTLQEASAQLYAAG